MACFQFGVESAKVVVAIVKAPGTPRMTPLVMMTALMQVPDQYEMSTHFQSIGHTLRDGDQSRRPAEGALLSIVDAKLEDLHSEQPSSRIGDDGPRWSEGL